MSVRDQPKKTIQSNGQGNDNISGTDPQQSNDGQSLNKKGQYNQERYRWVIIALVSLSFTINNLANNAIIPIASKVVKVYGLHQTYANLPIQISFLINPIMNFTAGHFIDSKGLGVSFRIGSLLYAIGMFGFVLINYGYHFVLIGAILVAFGQPLIMNSPAKIATFWFLNRNRTLATGVINAINIITLGISLVFPALFVNEDSYGDQAKQQIFGLYSKYFLAGVANFVLILFFMRQKPQNLPSAGAQRQKSSFKQSLQIIKQDTNLWKFLSGSILLYGTFLSFGSTSNLLFKPFGYQDTQIALFGVSLLVSGIIGSVAYTLYIKKTLQYRKAIIIACSFSVVCITAIGVVMLIMPEQRLLITLMILGMGFNLLPMVPISHDLGCQLAFPVGQAQIVGLITGISMLYTVLLTLSITSFVGFGTTRQSAINLGIYIIFFTLGSIIYGFVNIDLKRRRMQGQIDNKKQNNSEMNQQIYDSSKNTFSQLLNKRTRSQSEQIIVKMDELSVKQEQGERQKVKNLKYIESVQIKVSLNQNELS